jgi:diguanylate cyclase (GGDEF)-like protein
MSIPKPKDPDSAVELYGQSRADLEFWLTCVGAPLVVVEKQTLTVRTANRNAAILFGIDLDTFAPCPIDKLVGEEAAHLLAQIWSNAPVGVPGEPFLVRARIIEQERLLMVQVSKIVVEGEVLRLFTFMDAPPQGSVQLASWQENIVDILNWVPFGLEVSTRDEQIQFANLQFNAMFGYSQDQIESIEDWWRLAYPDPDYRHHARTTWETSVAEARAEDREMTPFELDVAVASGGKRTIQFRNRPIGNFNINLYLDVTQERAYARELKRLAETDPLTGVMNRRHFFEEAELRYEGGQLAASVAVLMLDIDNFKRINDLYGHGTGDLVLKEFTRRCRAVIRKDDLLARLGGEEFVVLLTAATAAKATDVGECIRNYIRALPFAFNGAEFDVTVSIGAASRLDGEASVESTISRADRALYAAKHAGRDCVVFDAFGEIESGLTVEQHPL